MPEDPRTDVERLLERDLVDLSPAGRELSSRARQAQRTIEQYLASGIKPRWMERLMDVESGLRQARRRLRSAHERLRRECAGDDAAFAARWSAYAHAADFRELNELIRQHNEWYPIERDLPMDPRTGDYVTVSGRSFRRAPVTADWILAEFPAS